ncbi:MAG TPA: glycosyltransferase family 1 protein [Polyangiaceae bacterium]|jgi:glycosyltransferase involved in cell wall biosynthesis
MADPKILLDLTPLVTVSSLRGIGRYVRGLVRGLSELPSSEALDVRGVAASPSVLSLELVDDLLEYCARPAFPPRNSASFLRNQQAGRPAQRLAKREGRLLHLTDPKGLPLTTQTPYTLSCHDLIPLVLYKEYLPRVPHWDKLYRALQFVRYHRPRRILACSHSTKRDLCARLDVKEELVDVVWYAVDHAVFNATQSERERERVLPVTGEGPFVLYMGAGDVRKDLGTLVAAFAASRLRSEARLIIAGNIGAPRTKLLSAQCQELGVSERVKLCGYVDEALVPALYRQAALHVFPSRYEGFGFPVLEALAAGAPTITSPGSSLDEVAGDAALIVPCGEPDALREAMESLFFDHERARDLRERGLRRASEFTWRACAEGTVAFWRRAAA